METEIIPRDKIDVWTTRHTVRNISESEWIDVHASGTLRKNKRLGFAYKSQYIHERVCWEYGHQFQCLPRSRVNFGDPISEGDCKPVTEAGWFFDRYKTLNGASFPEDYYECKYINVATGDDEITEGIGIIVRATCANWLPSGHILFCIIAEYDKWNKEFKPAQNPF